MFIKRIFIASCILTLLAFGCTKTQRVTNKIVNKPATTTSTTPATTTTPPNGKVVYLTFDADMTPAMAKKLQSGQISSWYSQGLIKYLQDNNIAATFFVTGMFAEIYPDEIKQWSKTKNFAIENHTYSHPGFEDPCYGLATVSTDEDKNSEMQRAQDILENLTGSAPKYLRHPGLCHNQHDDDLAAKLNLKISDEGLASGDAFNTNTDAIVTNVLKNIKPGDIVIFHTGGPNAPAAEAAIKQIVPKLQKEGYSFEHL